MNKFFSWLSQKVQGPYREMEFNNTRLEHLTQIFFATSLFLDFFYFANLLDESALSEAQWLWPVAWLALVPAQAAAGLLFFALLLLHLACALKPGHRPFKALATLLLFFLLAIKNSFAYMDHIYYNILYTSFWLSFFTFGKKGDVRGNRIFYVGLVFSLLGPYFLAGTWKCVHLFALWNSVGWSGEHTLLSHLQMFLHNKGLRLPQLLALPENVLRTLWIALSLLEMSVLIAAFRPSLLRITGVALLLFHAFVFLSTNIDFFPTYIPVALFIACGPFRPKKIFSSNHSLHFSLDSLFPTHIHKTFAAISGAWLAWTCILLIPPWPTWPPLEYLVEALARFNRGFFALPSAHLGFVLQHDFGWADSFVKQFAVTACGFTLMSLFFLGLRYFAHRWPGQRSTRFSAFHHWGFFTSVASLLYGQSEIYILFGRKLRDLSPTSLLAVSAVGYATMEIVTTQRYAEILAESSGSILLTLFISGSLIVYVLQLFSKETPQRLFEPLYLQFTKSDFKKDVFTGVCVAFAGSAAYWLFFHLLRFETLKDFSCSSISPSLCVYLKSFTVHEGFAMELAQKIIPSENFRRVAFAIFNFTNLTAFCLQVGALLVLSGRGFLQSLKIALWGLGIALAVRLLFLTAVCAATWLDGGYREITLLIRDVRIMVPTDAEFLDDACIAIADGKIKSIAQGDDCAKISARKTISYAGQVVMPGFINTHTHGGNFLLRGVYKSLTNWEWWEKIAFPLEMKLVDGDVVYQATFLNALEFVASGITTANDMYYFASRAADAYDKVGLRAYVSESAGTAPAPSYKNYDEMFARIDELFVKWAHHERITPSLALHGSYLPQDIVQKTVARAEQKSSLITMHLLESEIDRQNLHLSESEPITDYLKNSGLDKHLVIAHGIYFRAEEIEKMAASGLGLSLNLMSNINLVNRAPPLSLLKKSGVTMGLGSDGAITNPNFNFFEELRAYQLLFPKVFTAKEILYLATLGGARVLKAEKVLGTIEVGKFADLIIFKKAPPLANPPAIYDSILQSNPSDLAAVYVGGEERLNFNSQVQKQRDEALHSLQQLLQKGAADVSF